MPNLFTLPGPRSGPDTVTSEQLLASGSHHVVAAGAHVHASLPRLFWADHNVVDFTNHGTIWNVSPANISAAIAGFYITSFVNSGLIVADAPNGNAGGVSVGGSGESLTNSGAIYAIANGNATAVEHWWSGALIANSGLIAAYAPSASTGDYGGVGSAVGVAMYNGGTLRNAAGGSILAEGVHAKAVIYGRGDLFGDTVIENDGRIEAYSLTLGQPSYGIYAGGLAVEYMHFVNRGLLKADIAWSSYDDHPIYAPKAADTLINETGGRIEGRIETGRGNDLVVNRGTLVGDVALGSGNDVFDTTSGTWTGVADLGWNDDAFYGSQANDIATGNRGSDYLVGGGGHDLLLGGVGTDHLIGGDGNDRLYGEYGNDHLVTAGGDFAIAGDGDDVIEAGDLRFALLDGGAGHDILTLSTGATQLDLAAVIATGRLSSIEHIALQDGQGLAVRAGDAGALAGGALEIAGGASTLVNLIGAWIEGAQEIRSGVAFRSFALGGETVLVQAGVAVALGDALPGFAGLDPQDAGGVAPLPGSVPGSELSNPVMTISNYHIEQSLVDQSLTIEAEETWQSIGDPVLLVYSGSAWLINKGVITAAADDGIIQTIAGNSLGRLVNSGIVRATATGDFSAEAFVPWSGEIENWGLIEAVAIGGSAHAATARGGPSETLMFANHGTISAHSSTGAATGLMTAGGNMFQSAPGAINYGLIEAIGGAGTVALKHLTNVLFVNDGTIRATNSDASGANDAVAFQSFDDGGFGTNRLDNRGTIEGVVAIRSLAGKIEITNSGTLVGAVILAEGDDWFVNSGEVFGFVDLGGGDDRYAGEAARTAATVRGMAGDDILTGGSLGDMLDGGEGADVLTGGGGADDLAGGAGADRFVYLELGDSADAAPDRIRGFESGIDKIDLLGLGVVTVSWSAQVDPSDGTSYNLVSVESAAGTMSIRVDGGLVDSDFLYTAVGRTVSGTAGDDDIAGFTGDDLLFAQQGGVDVVRGLAGNDGIYFGAALDPLDVVEGGTGIDTLVLQGSYPALQLGAVVDIEILLLASGADQRFGDTAGNAYSYGLVTRDSNVAAGRILTVLASGLGPGEHFAFDGSAETDGHFRIFAGQGSDLLVGGAGSDGFFFGADRNFSASDRVDGGAGIDSIAFRGNHVGADAVRFEDASFSNIEVIVLLSGRTNEHGGFIAPDGFDYALIMADGNVGLAQRLEINAVDLSAGETLNFDGSAERDGAYRVLAGAGDDVLLGGGGADILYGGLGADRLDGGDGFNTYLYRSVAESVAGAMDEVALGFVDRIDLAAIDADAGTPENEAFRFVGSAAFSGSAGELRAFQQGGRWIVEGDVDGDAVADLVIAVTALDPIVASNFIL